MKRMSVTILVDVDDKLTKEAVAEIVATSMENRGVFNDTALHVVCLDSVGDHEANKRRITKR